ncbi:MAG: hypothetical protein AB1651_19245 [Pseudomonadota bacterium]
MSLRGKEVSPELDAQLHERLRIMAEFRGTTLQREAARLLEKAIVGEWHEFSVALERAERSGILRNGPEKGGKGVK